jgi:hypothetical protein
MAFATNSAMTAASILFCFILRFFLARSNRQMDREEGDSVLNSIEGHSLERSTIAAVVKKPRYVQQTPPSHSFSFSSPTRFGSTVFSPSQSAIYRLPPVFPRKIGGKVY